MSEWTVRRFWTEASVVPVGAGFGVQLDGRPVKTPGKSDLAVPTEALAREIAREWDAQDGEIDPRGMPFTRTANTAIEKVAPQRQAVADMLAKYADSDATCYRADAPDGLVSRQQAAWDPLIDWAAATFGARLIPVVGVMHQPQPPAALARLAAEVDRLGAFELAGLHDLVALSGSLLIGLAASRDAFPAADLWQRSRIDETWQQERWGVDDEAAALAEAKRQGFDNAHRFVQLLRMPSD